VKSVFFSCSCHVVILHYTKNCYSRVFCFVKICNCTLLCSPIAVGASVDDTLQVCLFVCLLVLPIVENGRVFLR
jgi:hypothetical protein